MEGSAVGGHPGSVEPTGLSTVLKELGGPAGAGSLGAREDCTRDGLFGAVTSDSDFFGGSSPRGGAI